MEAFYFQIQVAKVFSVCFLIQTEQNKRDKKVDEGTQVFYEERAVANKENCVCQTATKAVACEVTVSI